VICSSGAGRGDGPKLPHPLSVGRLNQPDLQSWAQSLQGVAPECTIPGDWRSTLGTALRKLERLDSSNEKNVANLQAVLKSKAQNRAKTAQGNYNPASVASAPLGASARSSRSRAPERCSSAASAAGRTANADCCCPTTPIKRPPSIPPGLPRTQSMPSASGSARGAGYTRLPSTHLGVTFPSQVRVYPARTCNQTSFHNTAAPGVPRCYTGNPAPVQHSTWKMGRTAFIQNFCGQDTARLVKTPGSRRSRHTTVPGSRRSRRSTARPPPFEYPDVTQLPCYQMCDTFKLG